MSLTVTATINSEIAWTQRDISSSTVSINDTSSIRLQDTLAYGTGSDQVNLVYQDSNSGTGTTVVDLFNLSRDVFGSTIIVDYSGGYIKYFTLKNNNTASGLDLTLAATGANCFSGPFNSGTLLSVRSDSVFLIGDPKLGWPVSSTARYLYINDGGSGFNYDIGIVGLV